MEASSPTDKVRTWLGKLDEALKGHEEKKGPTREQGVAHGAFRDRETWAETRAREQAELGATVQPHVVIIGGGQGGIALGARLRRLGVPCIILEKNERASAASRRASGALEMRPGHLRHRLERAARGIDEPRAERGLGNRPCGNGGHHWGSLAHEPRGVRDAKGGSIPMAQPATAPPRRTSRALGAAAALLLAGCTGSDFAQLGSDLGDHIGRELLGNKGPPAEETLSQQEKRARDFARRADALVATGAWADGRRVAPPECAATRCTWPGDAPGVPPDRALSDLFPPEIAGVVARDEIHDGATGFVYSLGAEARRTWGYWMTHAVFGLADEPGPELGRATHFGFAGGDRTGSRPSATARWSGPMVGTAVEDPATGTRLLGDAALTWSTSAPDTVEVSLGNIRSKASGAPWPVGAIRFDGIPLDAAGAFAHAAEGRSIRGGFHGPAHAEAAGAFEASGIVGAFGARRR